MSLAAVQPKKPRPLCVGPVTDDLFPENLAEPGAVYTITQLGTIFTACQDGKIPFVSADDIAEVAFHALTNETSYDCDLRVLGPELLTYDDVSSLSACLPRCADHGVQVAKKLSVQLGKDITHTKLDEEKRLENLVQAGLPEYYARFFTNIEARAAEGLETALNSVIKDVTGHHPRSFDDFIKDEKAVWSSASA